MAQTITTKYQEFDTSAIQNQRYVNVIPVGVYKGYQLSANPGVLNTIDISSGADGVSTLVTQEGVVVTESASVPSAVRITPSDPSFDRIDLIVAEYQYSTIPTAQQVYKVVRGVNQINVGSDPIAPSVQNQFQVPLGFVTVSAGSGLISSTDIRPVAKANWTDSDDWTNLRSVISTGDNRVLYVYPGVFTGADGTEVLSFQGGYSPVISDETFLEGTSRWYLFGITDDLKILTVAFSDTKVSVADTSNNTLILCRAQVRMINGRTEIQEVEDLRLPFSRTSYQPNEDLKYQDLLATSVFKYVRIENFDDVNNLVSGTETGGTVLLNSATRSLRINGTTEEVTFTTNDMITGGNISEVGEFLVAADSTIQNLKFDYSTVSPTSGFTTNRYNLGELIKVNSVSASQLYLKFYVPVSEFADSSYTTLFSYGILINLDNRGANLFSVAEFGVRDLTNSVTNLISNGDFYHWSKNTTSGKEPNLMSLGELEFPVSDAAPQLADGWQFTNINSSFASNSVKRIYTNGDSGPTALRLTFASNPNPPDAKPTVLEFRIPRGRALSGKRITFALDYAMSSTGAATIGVAQFRRTDAGLVLLNTDEQVARNFIGTVKVITKSSIDSQADVISFYIKYDPTIALVSTVWNVRAAAGEFPVLPFSYTPDAADALRGYYERGTFYLATAAQSGQVLGSSTQFGSPKHLELGDIVAQVSPSSAVDRSSNVSNISFSAKRDSITVSASATTDSSFILQTDWEAFIKYTGSVV